MAFVFQKFRPLRRIKNRARYSEYMAARTLANQGDGEAVKRMAQKHDHWKSRRLHG